MAKVVREGYTQETLMQEFISRMNSNSTMRQSPKFVERTKKRLNKDIRSVTYTKDMLKNEGQQGEYHYGTKGIRLDERLTTDDVTDLQAKKIGIHEAAHAAFKGLWDNGNGRGIQEGRRRMDYEFIDVI